jgi:hypothetical protein
MSALVARKIGFWAMVKPISMTECGALLPKPLRGPLCDVIVSAAHGLHRPEWQSG